MAQAMSRSTRTHAFSEAVATPVPLWSRLLSTVGAVGMVVGTLMIPADLSQPAPWWARALVYVANAVMLTGVFGPIVATYLRVRRGDRS